MQNFIKAVKKMHKKYLNNGTQKKTQTDHSVINTRLIVISITIEPVRVN